MTTEYDDVGVGDTITFQLDAVKDGAVWDLTGATVTLLLKDPLGDVSQKAATVTDGPAGVAQYTTLTTDLHSPGDWQRAWKVSLGGVILTRPAPWVAFKVYN